MLGRASKGQCPEDPILISSASGSGSMSPLPIGSMSSPSNSSPESLGAALSKLPAKVPPGRSVIIRQPEAGPSHVRDVKPSIRLSSSPRSAKRRVDETLVSGINFNDKSRTKPRHRLPGPGQTTLDPQGGIVLPKDRRSINGPERREDRKGNAISITAPGAVGGSHSKPSRSKLGHYSSGGTSTTDAIIIDTSDDDSLPRLISRPPKSSDRSTSGVLSRSRSRRSATPTKRGRLGSLFPDDGDDPTIAERAAAALTQHPRPRGPPPRVLVPETVPEDDGRTSSRTPAEATPPRRKPPAETMANPFLVPETPPPANSTASKTTSPAVGYVLSQLDKKVLGDRQLENGASPSSKVVNKGLLLSPPQSSLLDGLARSPTPKKTAPIKSSPLPTVTRGKRPFDHIISIDDESWRPPPNKTSRSASSRRHLTPEAAISRPRRVNTAPGKYTLPAVDTPIHQWPTAPALQVLPAKRPAAGRKLPPSKLSDAPLTPERTSRSRSMSSPLTPLPATQLPERAVSKMSDEAADDETDPAEPTTLETLPLTSTSESDDEADAAESVLDLSEFAQFADMTFSPAPSNTTPIRKGSSRPVTPSSRSVGPRTSISPLTLFRSLPSIPEREHGTPSRRSATVALSPKFSGHPSPAASKESVAARILREQENEEREHAERDARARKEAQERQERFRAQLQAAEDTEEEEEQEEEISLSQILRAQDPNRDLRRSTRTRSSIPRVASLESPKGPGHVSAQAFSRLMRETKREERSGATRNIIEALSLSPSKTSKTANASTEMEDEEYDSDVDMDHLDDVDEDMLAHVKAARAKLSTPHSVDAEALNWAFWNPEVPGPEVPYKGPEKNVTMLAVSSGPGPYEVHTVFYNMMCTPNEDLVPILLDNLLASLRGNGPIEWHTGDGTFAEMVEKVWYGLGAKLEVEDQIVRWTIARDRQVACALACQVIRSVVGTVPLEEHDRLLPHLVLLLADSTTSSTLAREVAQTIAALIPGVAGGDSLKTATIIADLLNSLSKATHNKVVLALGQATSSLRNVVRWTAMLLLLPDCGDYVKDSMVPPVSLLDHILKNFCLAVFDAKETGAHDYASLSRDIALWSSAASDIPALIEAASPPERPHPLELLTSLTILRNSIRDTDQDVDTSAIKTRLHQLGEIIRWKSEHVATVKKKRRLEGKGLELGLNGQTKLSLGR